MQVGSLSNNYNFLATNQHKAKAEEALDKIAASRELSGKDGATLINADMLNSQIATMTQEVQNENANISMLQIANGTLEELQKGTNHLNELFVAHNNAALNSDQQAMLAQEFNNTLESMSDMLSQSTYNNQALFGSSSPLGLSDPELSSVSITDQESIESLQENVSSLLSDVSSATQEAQVSVNNLLAGITSAASSYSQISETPMDENINELSQSNLNLNVSTITQVHNNAILQQQMAALLKF
jgi:flagellin